MYFKDVDAIVAVLAAIGAFEAVLHLEDVRALKETKNRIHRLVNTEAANVERAAGAAAASARRSRSVATRTCAARAGAARDRRAAAAPPEGDARRTLRSLPAAGRKVDPERPAAALARLAGRGRRPVNVSAGDPKR